MKSAIRWNGLRITIGLFLFVIAQAVGASTPGIAAADGHTLAVDRFGTVYAWGSNISGQLGDGTTNPSLVPIVVPGLSGVVDIGAGGGGNATGFSLAVRSDGVVFGWGFNGDGELGLGNTSTGP